MKTSKTENSKEVMTGKKLLEVSEWYVAGKKDGYNRAQHDLLIEVEKIISELEIKTAKRSGISARDVLIDGEELKIKLKQLGK